MNQLTSSESPADLPGEAVVPGALPAAALPGTLSEELRAELIAFRRDLHMHPELGNQEFRTTAALKARLELAGLRPRVLSMGTGLICDIGRDDPLDGPADAPVDLDDAAVDHLGRGGGGTAHLRLGGGVTYHLAQDAAGADHTSAPHMAAGAVTGGARGMLALRADIDALPIPDTKIGCVYRSTVPDRAHACGHDVHTTVVLGAGLVLAELHRQGALPRPVRLLFQPAEEVLPGGAPDAIDSGVLEGVGRIIAVHCDPKVDAGRIGLRHGPITSACDRLEIALDGPGGHTARPHLTTDLVTAAARVAVDVPSLVARRVDARSGLAVTWGRIESGHACNVVPQHAELSGTVRCLDLDSWRQAPDLVHAAIDEIANLYRAKSEINYIRGVPPVVNDPLVTELLHDAMAARRGVRSIEDTPQSLGGEDFSWYLEQVPGAMVRLGVRTPGEPRARDLHQGDFDADEFAITVGVELFTAAALLDAARF